jgi:hypothetical protein
MNKALVLTALGLFLAARPAHSDFRCERRLLLLAVTFCHLPIIIRRNASRQRSAQGPQARYDLAILSGGVQSSGDRGSATSRGSRGTAARVLPEKRSSI